MVHERCVIVNKTKGICLASEADIARSIITRMKGLIGCTSREFYPGRGLWLMPCNGIHTFGMRMPIDVAYLDSKNRVLKLCHRLEPSRVASLVLRARSVLELPSGTLAQTHTEVGDVLEIRGSLAWEQDDSGVSAAAQKSHERLFGENLNEWN